MEHREEDAELFARLVQVANWPVQRQFDYVRIVAEAFGIGELSWLLPLETGVSETKSSWASMSTVAEMLVTSDDVSKIHFYVTKHENRPAELHCRCHGLLGMTKTEIEKLASELNDAMAPVLKRYEGTLQSKAANQLRRFL